METIRYTKMDMDRIINTLMQGGILAFPTDTVFGLGCIIDEKAIDAIYTAKERDFSKSLPMMCDGIQMMEEYVFVDERARKIIEHFTPGALTVVLKKKEKIKDLINPGKDTIAIRIPDDEWILGLISRIAMPLLVTSANISSRGSLLRWEDVYECMNGRIDAIVCEDASGDSASTIIEIADEIKLLREGPIAIDDILEVLE